jgi:small subunit ribosomal protein S8
MDTIANMLTIIRNAMMVKHESVRAPYSRVNLGISEILKNNGWVKEVSVKKRGEKKWLVITLQYNEDEKSAITGIRRLSKPGQRKYVKQGEIPNVRSGYGLLIISTSKGIMTEKEARKASVGGEILCEVW